MGKIHGPTGMNDTRMYLGRATDEQIADRRKRDLALMGFGDGAVAQEASTALLDDIARALTPEPRKWAQNLGPATILDDIIDIAQRAREFSGARDTMRVTATLIGILAKELGR